MIESKTINIWWKPECCVDVDVDVDAGRQQRLLTAYCSTILSRVPMQVRVYTFTTVLLWSSLETADTTATAENTDG